MERIAGHVAALNWHAVRLYRLSRWLWEHDQRALALIVFGINRVLTGVEIPPSAEFGPGLVIMHGQGIVVHPEVRAGRDCVMYQQVTIGANVQAGATPRIGDRVEMLPGAKVAGDITIGDDAVSGANSVVVRDVPAGAKVLVPASQIKP